MQEMMVGSGKNTRGGGRVIMSKSGSAKDFRLGRALVLACAGLMTALVANACGSGGTTVSSFKTVVPVVQASALSMTPTGQSGPPDTLALPSARVPSSAAPASGETLTHSASSSTLGSPVSVVSDRAAACSSIAQIVPGATPTTGVVYYDANQNGKQDIGEPGLPGVPLYLAAGPDAETPASEKSPATCTDVNGHFSLTPPDAHSRYQLWVRTGWFRTQCAALRCVIGSAGDNVQTGPEWIYSRNFVSGAKPGSYMIGLIPDAGQYVKSTRSTAYSSYPPDLSQAHMVDLAARFTDDESPGCHTTKNGVNCRIGGAITQTLYIGNSGMSPVSGIRGVLQLPYGETHRDLILLSSGSSPRLYLSNISVTPALLAAVPGQRQTMANFTTITFTLNGTLPPAGIVSLLSKGVLTRGVAGTQIVGRAGVTAEDNAQADRDSGFCPTPAVPTGACSWISDTHSMLDLHGDDTDSDRFNVLK